MTSLGTHLYSDSSLVPPSLFSVKGSDCVTSSSVGPSCFILLKSWTHSLPDKGLLCDLDRYQIQTNAHAGQMEISIMSSNVPSWQIWGLVLAVLEGPALPAGTEGLVRTFLTWRGSPISRR